MTEVTENESTRIALAMIETMAMAAREEITSDRAGSTLELLMGEFSPDDIFPAAISLGAIFLNILPDKERVQTVEQIRRDLNNLEAAGIVRWDDLPK